MKSKKTNGKMLFCLAMFLILNMMCTVNVSATQNRSKYYSTNYTLTENQAQDVMAVAKAQVGKTKSSLKYTEAWCADFVLDCARLAKLPDNIIPYNYKSGGGCSYLYNYMLKSCNAKVTNSPVAGDLVFYYCTKCKKYVHVGYYAGSGYHIEGNVSGKVLKYNTYYCDVNGHSVKGGTIQRIYVHPNYKKSMVDCKITLGSTKMTYTRKALSPLVTVKYGSTTLKKGTDYTYSLYNNVNVGTAKVVINGTGNYAGKVTKTFTIEKRNISALIFVYIKDQTYTGSQIKPSITVKYGSTVLKNGSDYKVTYGTNKSTGKGTVTVTGIGNYTGTKQISFYIVPKMVTGLTLKASGKSLTVSFAKATGATGYQIAYRKKGACNWKYLTSSINSKKISSLSALTNYQVQVRPYVQVNTGSKNEYKYGAWCSPVSKTTGIF